MNKNFENISHYGDIIAIPFFALLIYYFISIECKTPIEYTLLLFSTVGFILDIFFTISFFALSLF